MDLIATIKESWGWVGIDPFHIVAENDFGNLIIEDTEERFWRLCPESAYCEVVANCKTELCELQCAPEFVADWEMVSLLEAAKNSLGELPLGQKYCLKVPGILGGAYELENIGTVPFDELISFSGDLGYQCKDLADGTQVILEVVD